MKSTAYDSDGSFIAECIATPDSNRPGCAMPKDGPKQEERQQSLEREILPDGRMKSTAYDSNRKIIHQVIATPDMAHRAGR